MSDDTLRHLAQKLGEKLGLRKLSLATAESCTGGWIGKVLTDVSGSSGWFERGFITYSNESKVAMLGVRQPSLDAYGAVSETVAREMAEGAAHWSRAQVAVAVTGIAGPDGGSLEKPVGTVWIAWRWADGKVEARHFLFEGDRESVRRQTVLAALQGLHDGL
ncbi:MAG TPA: nicotinamide-nucleotide amidase [Gammaproteobacteria bacterium]|nr:nicotinamide-nucleotide amidase [Gammaproteobacteria bacterium]